MSEYRAQGNIPPGFEGTLTAEQQERWDAMCAVEELTLSLPPSCHDCLAAQALLLTGLGEKVVGGTLTIEAARAVTRRKSEGCTGPQPDMRWHDGNPICETEQRDEQERHYS